MVRVDGTEVALLGIADRTRPAAAAAVARITAVNGTAPILLTGDNVHAARRLAAQVGIRDVRAGLLPQDKAAAVTRLQAEGHRVLLAGDGINDAPALAAAHTGVAMGRAGSDLALDTAVAVIMRDDLSHHPRHHHAVPPSPPGHHREPRHRRRDHRRWSPGTWPATCRCRSAWPATRAPPSSSATTGYGCCATLPGAKPSTGARHSEQGREANESGGTAARAAACTVTVGRGC